MKMTDAVYAAMLLICGAVLCSTPAAADSVSNDNDITDPSFLLTRHQASEITAYSYALENGDGYNYLGGRDSSFEEKTQTITQYLSYAFTDRLNVTISGAYEPTSRTKTTSISGATTDRNDSGFADPTLQAKYRVLTQGASSMNWDIQAAYSPNVFDAESATNGRDGTVARGSQAEALSSYLSHVFNKLTLQLNTQVTHYGAQESESLANGTLNDLDPYWSYLVGINTQRRFSDRFSINANVNYTFYDSEHDANRATQIVYTTQPDNMGDFGLAMNYEFIPGRLSGSLLYDYFIYSDATQKYLNVTSDTTTKNQDKSQFGAKLKYIF